MSKSDIPAKPQGYIPVSLGWLLFGMSLPNPDMLEGLANHCSLMADLISEQGLVTWSWLE